MSKQNVFYLPSHFGPYLNKELKFSKKVFNNFIDLGLHFDLCENESYSSFVAKVGFFTRRNVSKKPRMFYKLKFFTKCVINCSLLSTH